MAYIAAGAFTDLLRRLTLEMGFLKEQSAAANAHVRSFVFRSAPQFNRDSKPG